MTDIEEHRKWLRETTHGLLTRFSRWRRRVKIGLVIGGALLAGAVGAAANLIGASTKWPFYIFQILGLLMVFAGGVLMEFLDEGAADAIKRANELADAVEERDSGIASLEEDFAYFTRLYAIAAVLREVIEDVAASGPGTQEARNHRFGAMLDVLAAENVILFGMDSDRWNFAIYLLDPGTGNLGCLACRRPIRAEEGRRRPTAPGSPARGMLASPFRSSRRSWRGTPPSRRPGRSSTLPPRTAARTTMSGIAPLPRSRSGWREKRLLEFLSRQVMFLEGSGSPSPARRPRGTRWNL